MRRYPRRRSGQVVSLELLVFCLRERGGQRLCDGVVRGLIQERRIPTGIQAGRKQLNAAAAGQPLFDVLQAPFDLQRQPATRDFEAFALPLSFHGAILLQRAQSQPAERADGH